MLRSLFLGALLLVVIKVAAPQNETIWSAYETLGDLVRVALGFALCVGIVVQLFILPRDEQGYRTWTYLGLVLAPLAVALAVVVW